MVIFTGNVHFTAVKYARPNIIPLLVCMYVHVYSIKPLEAKLNRFPAAFILKGTDLMSFLWLPYKIPSVFGSSSFDFGLIREWKNEKKKKKLVWWELLAYVHCV